MPRQIRGQARACSKLAAIAVCLATALPAAAPAGAEARPPIQTVLQDDAALLHQSDAEVAATMAQLKSLGVDRVRITAGWSVIAPDPDSRERPDFDATDPDAYPRANWRNLDRAVLAARAADIDVMIDIAFWAPLWATAGDPGEGRARWNVDPAAFADFTKAVVTRYSGSFRPEEDSGAPPPPARDRNLLEQLLGRSDKEAESEPTAPQPSPSEPLPAVRWWTIWNEPNHPGFVQPQWIEAGGRMVPNSPHLYRRLVEAAYPAIKGIQPDSLVLVGGTSSTGDKTPTSVMDGMPPLRFLRALACVDGKLRPVSTGACADYRPLAGDGFSHHPYSLLHRPDHRDDANPDNLPIGSLDRLTRTLDRLVKMRRIDPKLRDVYLTEFGYETNPPDPIKPFNLAQQARFINWAEFLAWRNPRVRTWPQFLIRDMGTVSTADAARGKREWGDWQSGLLFSDGTPKPSLTSFRLALFAECVERRAPRRSGKRSRARSARARYVRIWGHLRPGSGVRAVRLVHADRKRGWRAAATAARLSRGRVRAASARPFATDAGGAFVRYASYRRGARYRFESKTPDGGRESALATAPTRCGAGRERGPRRDDGEY